MSDERVELSFTAAKKRLVKGRTVHTFRIIGHILMGCDMAKAEVLNKIKLLGAEEAGPNMSKMDHAIAVWDEEGWLFLETKQEL